MLNFRACLLYTSFTDDTTLVTEGLKAIAEGLKEAIVAVFTFIKDNILTPFSDFLEKVFRVNFEKTFGLVGMYMESWGKTLKDIVNSVKQVFQGIIDFVTGVFSSNWSQAWNLSLIHIWRIQTWQIQEFSH